MRLDELAPRAHRLTQVQTLLRQISTNGFPDSTSLLNRRLGIGLDCFWRVTGIPSLDRPLRQFG